MALRVLGINGGFRAGYQDISACIVEDGKLLAAVEEERINRIKFSPGKLPLQAIHSVLNITGLQIADMDAIAFHGSTWGDGIDGKVRDYFMNHFGYAPPLKKYHHHDCHAASTFFASGFEEALLVSMDNSGDGISLQLAIGKGQEISLLKRFPRPTSLGVFYSMFTQYCGFTKDSDEYKLMGLAAYGNPERYDFSWLMDVKDGELSINTAYVVTVPASSPSLHRDEMNFNEAFIAKMGRGRRLPHEPINAFYMDVAASAQRHLENMLLKLLRFYSGATGLRNICFAGGVALNCLMNQKVMDADFVDRLYVYPASSDAGISVGAAWLYCAEKGIGPVPPSDAYLGQSYSDKEIESLLEMMNIPYTYHEDIAEVASAYIAEHKVIAWFQGRMEFGPRALGNRSILANPASGDIKSIVNKKIKFRDSFRPFGASVLEEDCHLFFEGKNLRSPYMNINYRTKPQYADVIKGVVHEDKTCRIQTVSKEQNPLYYDLLQKIKEKTGLGICLNTSFNLNYEPIVNTPQNAVASFYGSGLDALFIGNYLIAKSQDA